MSSVPTSSIDVEPTNTFALLGGGPVLVDLAKYLKSSGSSVRVFTSERLLNYTGEETNLTEIMENQGIPCTVTANIGEDKYTAEIASSGGIAISFGAPWIFRSAFIDQWNGCLLNSHPAPLPEHRGGGGYSWRILMNDRRGATCVHVVTPGLDEGDIVWYKPYLFTDECLIPADYESTQIANDITSLRVLIDQFKQGTSLASSQQNHSSSTYFPRLETDTHGWIDWSQSVEDVVRAIRAFDRPYAGASTTLDGHDVRIRGAQIVNNEFTFHPFQAGLIYRKLGDRHFVACRNGGISVDKIELESSSADQKNSVRLGDRLFSPAIKLQAALEYRAAYRP